MLNEELQRGFDAWPAIVQIERKMQRARRERLDLVRREAAQEKGVAGRMTISVSRAHLGVREIAQSDASGRRFWAPARTLSKRHP